MTTIFRSAPLPVTPDQAWQRISAVDKVHEILPAVIACTLDGESRTCTFADGAVLKERIVSVDSALMRVAYTVTDSPFGFEYHSAAMQIIPEGAGARVQWTTDVKPDTLKEGMEPMFDQLFAQLVAKLSVA